jgi:hypothetical protein
MDSRRTASTGTAGALAGGFAATDPLDVAATGITGITGAGGGLAAVRAACIVAGGAGTSLPRVRAASIGAPTATIARSFPWRFSRATPSEFDLRPVAMSVTATAIATSPTPPTAI